MNKSMKGHMCRYLFVSIIVLLFLFSHCRAYGASIVAVQSINIKPYNDALRGYKDACNCDVKRFVVSEMNGDVVRNIYRKKPSIVLAIGIDALQEVRRITDIPIIYCMILNPKSILADKDNITGVSLYINPEKQLSVLQKTMPSLINIGLLYDPVVTGGFVKKARSAAVKADIALITEEVTRSKDVPEKLERMKGKINVFWMLPDLTVVTPETVEFLLLFSIENRIPVITFSEKYLEMGALMSIDIDAVDIGKQAWELSEMVLSGKDIRAIQKVDARKEVVTVNQRAAKKLGISIDDKMFGKIRIINRE